MVFNTGSVVILDGRIRVYSGGLGVDCGTRMVFNTGSVVILDGRIRVYSGGVGVDCGYNKQEGGSSNRPISERFQSALEATKQRRLTSLSSFQDRIDAIKPESATPMFMVGLILGERLSNECAISTVTSRKTGARVYALQEDMALLSDS
ncbi:Hypp693 [Branchiostoma lanceolatum]|uniref:Hypp693 protein n=1 Tax=Branchiostoma lanceolatum TaxID=7740 RepID=A0A8J9YLS1_BRALA|nr:Hypp693 [Branchiostoma lanceolatum]